MQIKRFSLLLSFLAVASIAFAGAWGHGSFENDDALDWVENGLKQSGQAAIQSAVSTVVKNGGYLEAPACSAAIAACEVLAAAQGRPSAELPKDVLALIKRLPSEPGEALRKEARIALEKILTKSELRDLWSDSKEFGKWKAAVESLKARL